MKSHEVSAMASGIMSKKRSYPDDVNEVEADEQDKGDFEGMSIDSADNGYSVHVRHKNAGKEPMPSGNHMVFGHEHPVAAHIHAILKHAKKK